MYLKVKRNGYHVWLLNGGTIEVSLNESRHFKEWLKENTNAYNGCAEIKGKNAEDEERIIEYFMSEGFTPVYECFGSKVIDGVGGKPKYELKDDIRWFLFDGVSEEYWYANKIFSIAVAWNKVDDMFTVYNNQYNDKKRIGIYDDRRYVFDLVEGYLPVKMENRLKREFSIDWNKVHNHVACQHKMTKLGGICSADVSDDIFEKRLGNIINRVIKNVEYFTDDKSDNPCGYKRDELKNHLMSVGTIDKGRTGVIRFYFKSDKGIESEPDYGKESWLEFCFEDEDNLRISMYDCMPNGSACCVESIRVQRRVTQVNKDYTLLLYERRNNIVGETISAFDNSHSLKEEALAYLPHLGVYTVEDIIEDKE